MSQKFTCDNCDKDFSTKGNLKKHKEQVCLRDESLRFICIYCNSNLTRKSILDNHMKTCPKKDEYHLRQRLDTIIQENETLKTNINNLNMTYTTKLQNLSSEHDTKIQELTNSYELKLQALVKQNSDRKDLSMKVIEDLKGMVVEKDKKIEYLRGQLKICKDIKPSVVNNINNNHNTSNTFNMYVQNLEPITDELINETGKKVGMLDLKDGAPGIMRKFHPVLKDRIVCTDATRNSLMYNYNGKLKRDTRGQMITDKIMSSTEPQYNMYKDEVNRYYQNLDTTNMTEAERELHDSHFDSYREYVKALKSTSEFPKKKVSRKISKTIANFSKSKSQFENQVENKSETQEETHDEQSVQVQIVPEPAPSVQSGSQPVRTDGRLNRVVSRRQTLVNGRIMEQHFDAQGQIVRQIRIRSSGLPYLTDEETDPSSREQSDLEEDSDNEFYQPCVTQESTSQDQLREKPKINWDFQE